MTQRSPKPSGSSWSTVSHTGVRYETMELFACWLSVDNPSWLKYQKPGLKLWLGETDACVLVYSCTNKQAFDLLVHTWDDYEVQAERDHAKAPTCKHRFVVHDNIDIDQTEWEVSLAEGKEFSRRINASFHPLSSRTGEGAENFGLEILTRMLKSL